MAGRGRGLFHRAWQQAGHGQDARLAGLPLGFLLEHVAHLLAHGFTQRTLEGRIGFGERLGQIPQIVDLTELMTAVGQDGGDGRYQARLFVAEDGQNRPLQVLQGGEERLERGLIQLSKLTTAQRQPCGQVAHKPNVRLAPLGREAIQGDDHAALLLGDLGQSPALLTLVAGQQG